MRPDFVFLTFKPLRHNRIFGFFWGESLKFFQISYKKKNTNFPVEDQQQRTTHYNSSYSHFPDMATGCHDLHASILVVLAFASVATSSSQFCVLNSPKTCEGKLHEMVERTGADNPFLAPVQALKPIPVLIIIPKQPLRIWMTTKMWTCCWV